MPRTARIIIEEMPYHVTQRSNYGIPIMEKDSDKKKYLMWFQKYCMKYKLKVITYCLMNNHVHFIVIPERNDSLARTFNCTHMRYAQYINWKEKRNGHLWQGRFYSCVMDQVHTIAAARYIERNPVRAGLVKKPWEWEWSSASKNIGSCESRITMGDMFEIVDMTKKSWKQYIDQEDDEKDIENIRRHTISGRPFVEKSMESEIQERLGRPLVSLDRGRPRKKEKKGAVPFSGLVNEKV